MDNQTLSFTEEHARRKWTKEEILRQMRKSTELNYSYLRRHNHRLLSACEIHFGSLRKAVEALGLDYDEITRQKPVNKKWVIRQIQDFVASGNSLSKLQINRRGLMRNAKALFGSVRRAFRAAGYRYDDLKRTPAPVSRWPTKEDVFRAIRRLPTTDRRAACRNHRPLVRRAEHLLGSWYKAVEAAGLSFERPSPPVWPAEVILKKIRRLKDKNVTANLNTRLYYSARGAFGSWRYAVELAGFPYFEVARRFRWSPKEVLYYIRWLSERGGVLNRRNCPELYRYTLEFFGNWERALRAAGTGIAFIHFKHKVKRSREVKNNLEIAKEMHNRALSP